MIYPPEQPFSLPSNTLMLNVANVVPAPTNADCERSEQMHECAGT